MTPTIAEFYEQLKADFAASKEYAEYDPDEDQGYFMEYLLSRLWQAEQRGPCGSDNNNDKGQR